MKALTLKSIVEYCDNAAFYHFGIQCRLSEEMCIPKYIRSVCRQNKTGTLAFEIESNLNASPNFDMKTEVLSFNATFSGSPFLVEIPLSDILAIQEFKEGGLMWVFNPAILRTVATNDMPTAPKQENTPPPKKGLRLVVDNTKTEEKNG